MEDEVVESRDVALIEWVSLQEYEMGMFRNIKEITNQFKLYLGEESMEDVWLNSKWVGRALKRLNLILEKRRMGNGRQIILNTLKAKEKLKHFKKDATN